MIYLESFVHLGSTLTSDGRSDTEIKGCIGIAKKAVRDLGQVLKNKKITSNTKKRNDVQISFVFNSIIKYIVK